MTMKKIISVVAAAATLTAASVSVMSLESSAATEIAQATLMGSFGTQSSWDYSGSVATVTSIDGDAQYQCEWNLTEATETGDSCFLTVVITPTSVDNFTTATFPDLDVTLDNVYVDGEEITDFDASSAVDLNYYEASAGVTRIYLRGDWAGNDTKIIDGAIESNIKVVFTVSGLGVEGTSNVTTEPEIEYTLGDVDSNNVVDAVDASLTLGAYAKTSVGGDNGLTETQELAADVNGDNVIDAVDASKILGYYAYTSTGGTDSPEDYFA